jgi:hypothetical protein
MRTNSIRHFLCNNRPPNCAPRTFEGADVSALHLVKPHELQHLREALRGGFIPRDFAAKLRRLAGSNLVHHYIEQQCRLFTALLQAAYEGMFPGATPAQRERLLRVLAYVRKDEDAIDDNTAGGFLDDHQEVRAVCAEFRELLASFKAWRLRHQVPILWLATV